MVWKLKYIGYINAYIPCSLNSYYIPVLYWVFSIQGKGSRELMFLEGLRFYIFLISPHTPPQTYLPLPSFICSMSKIYPNPFGLSPNPPVTPKPKASFSFSFDLNCYSSLPSGIPVFIIALLQSVLYTEITVTFHKTQDFGVFLLLSRLYFLEQF